MKKALNLTAKIYTIEFLSGMFFYSLGILITTPPTNPEIFKIIGIGSMLLILLAVIIKTLFTNSEKLDERAKNNFYKSSTITLLIALVFLVISGLLSQFLSLNLALSPAIVSFALATILVAHSSTFRTLELAGT